MTLYQQHLEELLSNAVGGEKDVFSPSNFNEYIGQEDTKELLKIAIKAAQNENRTLPSIMLTGAFGLGKTSLAIITAKEFGKTHKLIDGASVNLKRLPSGFVIIDEIHNVPPEVCDSLNLELDAHRLQIIGCTTNPGVLPGAFRSRFRTYQLRNYSIDELVKIAKGICNRKGVTATDTILKDVALRSRSNARQLTKLLEQIFDLLAVSSQTQITSTTLNRAFGYLGVDQKGYLERDREYVRALPNHPVGINWLSSVLGIDSTTIEEEIEPYLLQTGVIDRTPKGRVKIKDF